MRIRVRKHPFRIQGSGWAVCVGVFCGERWYRLDSWKAYSRPLIRGLGAWDRGFSFGPILFWKEG